MRKIIQAKNGAKLNRTKIEVCEIIQLLKNNTTMDQLSDMFPKLTMGEIKQIQEYYKNNQKQVDLDILVKNYGSLSMSELVTMFPQLQINY